MVNVETIQPKQVTNRKIGNTTYVVTSHFQRQGATAVDKIRFLLNSGMKVRGSCHK